MSLLEMIIALAIGVLVIGGAGTFFVKFRTAQSYVDKKAETRSDLIQAGALLQSVFARRNVNLDFDASSTTRSVQFVKTGLNEVHITVRKKPNADGDVEYTFYNACTARTASLPAPPPGPLGSCAAACPADQRSTIALRVDDGASSKSRTLVGGDTSGKAGTTAEARLCIVTPGPTAPGTDLVWVQLAAIPYGDGGFVPVVQTAESLAESVRDPRVEFTSRD